MNAYAAELNKAMLWLASKPDTLFLGQAVCYPGTAMFGTLNGVPPACRLEMPVAEDMQMGVSIGMSLAGYVPVSLFTRWNFLLLATNQLVNHLDKMPSTRYQTKVIIRTGVGSRHPMDPGPQHLGDFTHAFAAICETVEFIRLDEARMIAPAYERAFTRRDGRSTVLVEISDKLND